jgi:hypothetical protein
MRTGLDLLSGQLFDYRSPESTKKVHSLSEMLRLSFRYPPQHKNH